MPLLSRKVRVSSLPYNFSIVLSVYISFCGNTKNPGFTVQSKLSAQPEQLFSLHNLHTTPSVTTPRSPEMTLWFFPRGFPNIHRISPPIVQGSPQANPAIIVAISPVTGGSFPSSAVVVRYIQSAWLGSTITIVNLSSPG